ncbi:hypothetical protein [Evansella cellulosilytica]|uniref:Uncharacterized protein n=1 Tax=Evansella cellulosilytica (strain ATCC 21833 / DSM 2522 / FERM P-1141 / JCM 9156 / N-4) TaxID=649639 RepID=E6U1T0_EVAC2|nr:hypothetical protein [Evansella cellulosilytica]ADU31577.1 hypothetical protein Bcell_3335 [Evansella cellulosilytica DSM 2522]
MIKKMIWSTLITCCSICVIVVMLFRNDMSFTFGHQMDEVNKPHTFENEDYIFFLDDTTIESVIKQAVSTTNDPLMDYLLPVSNQESDIFFAYIETPKYQIESLARMTYYKFGRVISVSEAKNNVTDQYIPFSIRFKNNAENDYESILIQDDEVIQPKRKVVKNNGNFITIFFSVDDINVAREATLKLLGENKDKAFTIDFSSYE